MGGGGGMSGKGKGMTLEEMARIAARHDTPMAARLLEAVARKWARDAKGGGPRRPAPR